MDVLACLQAGQCLWNLFSFMPNYLNNFKVRLLFKLGFDGVDHPPGISSCCGPTRSSLTPGSGPRPNSPGEAPFKAIFERSVSS
jgi:hypothetical protein